MRWVERQQLARRKCELLPPKALLPGLARPTYLRRLGCGYHVDSAGLDTVRLGTLIEGKAAFPPSSVSIR